MSTHRYGLIGKSLEHSFSKQFFSDLFVKNKLNGLYSNLEFQNKDELKSFFEETVFKFNGLNVTIPYKTDVIPFFG